jgi:hypothetical protein
MSDSPYVLTKQYVEALLAEHDNKWHMVVGVLESNLATMLAGHYSPERMTAYIQERIKE